MTRHAIDRRHDHFLAETPLAPDAAPPGRSPWGNELEAARGLRALRHLGSRRRVDHARAYGAALVLAGVGLVSLLIKLVVEQLLGGVKESKPIN